MLTRRAWGTGVAVCVLSYACSSSQREFAQGAHGGSGGSAGESEMNGGSANAGTNTSGAAGGGKAGTGAAGDGTANGGTTDNAGGDIGDGGSSTAGTMNGGTASAGTSGGGTTSAGTSGGGGTNQGGASGGGATQGGTSGGGAGHGGTSGGGAGHGGTSGGGTGGTAMADTTPPTVVSVSPSNNATGVGSSAKIVVTFSEAMNKVSAQAAYQSTDLPAAGVTFAWNAAGTTLTITPNAALSIASGAANVDGSPAFTAKKYAYALTNVATDLAGNPLANVGYGFSTLRQVTFDIPPDPARTGTWSASAEGSGVCMRVSVGPHVCMGYDENANDTFDGFLSFTLPVGITQFISAKIAAQATRVVGSSLAPGPNAIWHVAFGDLSNAAFTATPATSLGAFFPDGNFSANLDVTAVVNADNAARVALSSRTQYRIVYNPTVIDSNNDELEMLTSGIKLASVYLVP